MHPKLQKYIHKNAQNQVISIHYKKMPTSFRGYSARLLWLHCLQIPKKSSTRLILINIDGDRRHEKGKEWGISSLINITKNNEASFLQIKNLLRHFWTFYRLALRNFCPSLRSGHTKRINIKTRFFSLKTKGRFTLKFCPIFI